MGASCRKLCSPSAAVQAAGSVLDRVISQASSDDPTILYKLADYKKGGLLIETYMRSGAAAAERLIKEEFSCYMYAGGRGRMINRAEYLRWKFRDQEHVVLPIEASLSPHDPLAKWDDHSACWQMRYRGALGESLLHVLIICDTKIHTRLARILLKCFPRLSLDVVEGEEYLGASSLHLAIAYSNNELVQDLVEAGADVGQRAIGSFFLPRDQQIVPAARHTDYEGLAYLGEYPLAWAACCANEAVYNLLLDSGADPDAQDSFGNMILHMVVVCDKLDMFGYALRHPKVPASNGKANKSGLTPLTLACKLGRAEVFREMLELSAREFWRYSNITCSAYPLNALDTLLPDGRTNWNSALFIILNGTKEAHLDMLDGGIIQRLLEEKWKTFARKQFLKRLLILLLHLMLLSCSIYLRPTSAELEGADGSGGVMVVESARDAVRLTCELGTLASTVSYIVLQQGDELKNQGVAAFFKQLSTEPAKAIFLASNLLLLAAIPARLAGDTKVEEAILLFAVPGCWFLLMFFAGAVRLTGPFVTMIYSMITGDMFTFGIIYSIILFGFSQSFFFLYRGFPNVQSTLYATYPGTWMALFQITLGDYTYSDLSLTTYPNLAKSVFAVFMVFVPILLLNMLIAMMGNTYAHVIEQSEKEWMKQWAKIVVSLERAIAQEAAHGYLQEYSMGLGPSDDPRYEQRAVMVIKSKDKTRAKQRKGALTNWKRVGKVTITELRRRGMTGEELRRLMWGRASISTPTKQPTRGTRPPDCVLISETTNVVGGVGSTLTSALDVMAFTHELDLSNSSTGLNLQCGQQLQKQPTPDLLVNGRVHVPSAPTSAAMLIPTAPQGATPMVQRAIGFVPPEPGFVVPGQQIVQGTMPGVQMVQGTIPGVQMMQGIMPGQQMMQGTVPGQQMIQATMPGQQMIQGTMPGLQMGVPAITITSGGMLGPASILSQLPAYSQVVQGVPIVSQQSVLTADAEATYRDYLRDLILAAECGAGGGKELRALAALAADVERVPQALIRTKPSKTVSRRAVVAGAMSGLFGVASDAPAPEAGWSRKPRATVAVLASDSEGPSESVLLGRASRARRVRSASRRAAPPPPHFYMPARSMYLVASESSAHESDASRAPHAGSDSDVGSDGVPRARQPERARDPRMLSMRPVCIQQALVTAGGVAEHAILITGEGSGADVEGPPPVRHKHERSRHRPCTAARRNRVSPGEPNIPQDGGGSESRLRPWATAPLQRLSRLLRSNSSGASSDESPKHQQRCTFDSTIFLKTTELSSVNALPEWKNPTNKQH